MGTVLALDTGSSQPSAQWDNKDKDVFYYEVQLSTDPEFKTEADKAEAAVYWNLVHGGETKPINSYQVPDNFPLAAGKTYYWRVRPRIQADGTEVAWSPNFSFRTAADASVQAMQTDFAVYKDENGKVDWAKMQQAYHQTIEGNARRLDSAVLDKAA